MAGVGRLDTVGAYHGERVDDEAIVSELKKHAEDGIYQDLGTL